METLELLSPAGNVEKLYYAYLYGADAAYIGLKKFSLRVKADNFYDEEYKKVCNILDTYNKTPEVLSGRKQAKKLYCALNISFHQKDIDNFVSDIEYFKKYPIDAFIVQDLGIVKILQKHFPRAALHLSTQANCINGEAAKMYRDMGFSRIVTGREASLEEIKMIKDKVPEMEIEAFAHGAMCIAYSGRCLMSAYMAGRSGNSGECAHSCRWDWRLYGEKQEGREERELFLEEKERPGELFPVYEGDGFTSILSSKDLSMIDHLKEMKDAGVTSFKIEGRMKSLYYTALITRAYRKGLDVLEGKIQEEKAAPFINEIEKVSHREFTTGFYFSREDADKTTKGETSSEYSLVGTIGEKTGENLFKFNSMNKIDAGTPIEYIGPDLLFTEDRDYKLLNPDTMEERDWVCHGHPCLIKTDKEIREGFIVRARLKK